MYLVLSQLGRRTRTGQLIVDIMSPFATCFAVVFKLNCWIPGIEVVDSFCQIDRLWGFGMSDRRDGTKHKAGMSWLKHNDMRESRVSSMVFGKPLQHSLIQLLPLHCCRGTLLHLRSWYCRLPSRQRISKTDKLMQSCRHRWVERGVQLETQCKLQILSSSGDRVQKEMPVGKIVFSNTIGSLY